jgi:hypothetical protein
MPTVHAMTRMACTFAECSYLRRTFPNPAIFSNMANGGVQVVFDQCYRMRHCHEPFVSATGSHLCLY